MVECSFMNYVVVGLDSVAVTWNSDFGPASSKAFLDIQATKNYRMWIHSKMRTWHDKNIQTRHFINRIFFNNFQIKIEKLSIRSVSLIDIIEIYLWCALNNYARVHLVWKQFNTSEHGYCEVRNGNTKRQFVYFIVAICRNTLKSF